MSEHYILVINKINGDDRLAFSKTINEYMPENILDDEKKELQNGYTITPETYEENPLFKLTFDKLKTEGYWSSWMQEWTSSTIYLLYKGETEISL